MPKRYVQWKKMKIDNPQLGFFVVVVVVASHPQLGSGLTKIIYFYNLLFEGVKGRGLFDPKN